MSAWLTFITVVVHRLTNRRHDFSERYSVKELVGSVEMSEEKSVPVKILLESEFLFQFITAFEIKLDEN